MAQLVEALLYKFAGSISEGVIGILHWHNPSGLTIALGSTQTPTEMSTRNISWGVKRPVPRADSHVIIICRLSWNLVASASCKSQRLSRSVMGLLYLIHKVVWIRIGTALKVVGQKLEDGNSMLLRNIGKFLPDWKVLHPTSQNNSLISVLWIEIESFPQPNYRAFYEGKRGCRLALLKLR